MINYHPDLVLDKFTAVPMALLQHMQHHLPDDESFVLLEL